MSGSVKNESVAVIGAGNMGAAIAEVMAYNGYRVYLKDQTESLVDAGMKRIRGIASTLAKYENTRASKEIARIEKNGIRLSEEQKRTLESSLRPEFTEEKLEKLMSLVTPELEYGGISEADIVIEAVFENLRVKRDVFQELEKVVETEAVLASNTSSISITSISSGMKNPGRMLITHFFNPPYTLPLVEIVPSLLTEKRVTEETLNFMSGLRNHRGPLTPVIVKESPGFVVNRMLVPMINEAIFLLEENAASREDIDLAMKKGAGMPMGPLELADMVGLDVTLDVCNLFYEQFGDPKYRPSVLLRRMVDAGFTGKKSGRGFYTY